MKRREFVLDTLVEGDVIKHIDGTLQVVEWGEVNIYSSGFISTANGALAPLTNPDNIKKLFDMAEI
jgi:hypothetical protein